MKIKNIQVYIFFSKYRNYVQCTLTYFQTSRLTIKRSARAAALLLIRLALEGIIMILIAYIMVPATVM